MTVTHAMTMNGRIHGELKDPVDPPEKVISKRLSLLDGVRRFSLGLWALPNGVLFDQNNLSKWPEEYVQVAGSRERMTIEVRRLEADGARQYVIGHKGCFGENDRQIEVVRWNGCQTSVFTFELFNADEAASVFISYYATGSIPESLTLRQLDL